LNWNFHLSLLPAIIVIIGLIIIYQQRAGSEEYLGLKLIGYYLLGSFNLHIGILIPIGIIIYLLFFHPSSNARVKRMSAWFGFIIMILSYFL
jgi:TRAP-type uncharacterized transport system fused permease subunit